MFILSFGLISLAQDKDLDDKILVIREAKEHGKTAVAVEGYLLGEDVLEVKVIARMRRTKPRIYNVIFVGPGVGRVVPIAKETIYDTLVEEEPFETTRQTGFISFGDRTEDKKSKGTLTRELFQFRIPTSRIKEGKKYQLWIKVQGMQRDVKEESFKFNLEGLPELLLE